MPLFETRRSALVGTVFAFSLVACERLRFGGWVEVERGIFEMLPETGEWVRCYEETLNPSHTLTERDVVIASDHPEDLGCQLEDRTRRASKPPTT
ncbi:hypothetical protein B0F90DRAFT_1326336 [Multifurca ochricompacta]|uniref:Uncharacterized protein n=1 Tax=Multifurca ochricompacta TaxID=376703 RepID=A0AAD4M6I9_9AGAM|nr:hypothetical protein B0F90DRAFT_1326336 [Multifurca ochricompacta]